MFQRYNTDTMPYTDGLRVCLSCWKRLPTYFSRRLLVQRFPNTTLLTCNGTCGTRWSCVSSHQRLYSTANQNNELDPTDNPFYKKYEQKLKQLKKENPEKFESKVIQMKQEKVEAKKPLPAVDAASPDDEPPQPPKLPSSKGPKSWPPESLDEIMKLDLVKDLEPQAIKQLWQEYHISKDCLFSVLNPEDFDEMMAKSSLNPIIPSATGTSFPSQSSATLNWTAARVKIKQHPVNIPIPDIVYCTTSRSFLCTLPKGDGFEFYLSQFSGSYIYFTSLAMYQLLKENSPACLTIAHFPELKEDKGLVLMAGEYDDKIIKKNEALNLAKQMTLYYGKDTGTRYNLIRQFNASPDEFQYTEIVEEYKRKREFLEDMPY